jgi:hypothetical protein
VSDYSNLPQYPGLDIPTCPRCGATADLRSCRPVNLLFLGVFLRLRHADMVACVPCLQSVLVRQMAVNVLTANLLCPFPIVWNGLQLLRTLG